MSDFTKEELKRLMILVSKSERIDPMDKQNYMLTYELRLKIQSTLENYCEHHSGDTTPRWYTCKSCNTPYLECDE